MNCCQIQENKLIVKTKCANSGKSACDFVQAENKISACDLELEF